MYVIVGLGNPGKKYENTRHNIGFECIDYIARKQGLGKYRLKHSALINEFVYKSEKIILVKPQTYMNLSGDAVISVLNYYGIENQNLIVIYDDIDIPLANIRIRKKGSAGSHNGMKDILYKIKTDDFPRIRIGIGKSEYMDLKDFVLSSYSKEEVKHMELAVINASKAIFEMIDNGVDMAMSKYNSKRDKKEKNDNAISEENNQN